MSVRLEITRATDIAVRAVQFLAATNAPVTAAVLAAHAGTTAGFLSQSLGRMVRRGWLTSEPGPKGGYRWAVDPSTVSVLDVIEALEGEVALTECVLSSGACRDGASCLAHGAWRAARDVLVDTLRKAMLAPAPTPPAHGRP